MLIIIDVGDILTKDPFKQTDRGRASDWRGTRENKQHAVTSLQSLLERPLEMLNNLCFPYRTVETQDSGEAATNRARP